MASPSAASSDDRYSEFDRARFGFEAPQLPVRRTDFARDRARVLHSSALRRLGAKTQVLSPSGGDFARTRLTHSLEVAQVGREMASDLGLNPDVVDMACLAHDLGHPPFGHNGEKALNDWALEIGGFEGNAQTLRLITRIEPKIVSQGKSFGLNLTRASLDATCKYPWARQPGTSSTGQDMIAKFGVYQDDLEIFNWFRQGAPLHKKSIEAQVMDFADDVAYSVHDFEDAIVSGYISIERLNDDAYRSELIGEIVDWSGYSFTADAADAALDRMQSNQHWPTAFDDSQAALAKLKNFTSAAIGSFVWRSTDATLASFAGASLVRFEADVVVPDEVKVEMAVLKGIVSAFLMSHASRRPFYEWQRALLAELCEALLAANGRELDAYSSTAWQLAADESAKRRVIVDQVASLTDQSALNLHHKLVTKAS